MKVRVGFGFGTTASTSLTATDLLSLVDHCEGLGWDSVWFSERITDGVLDALALMAAVAGRTERIKFGPERARAAGAEPRLPGQGAGHHRPDLGRTARGRIRPGRSRRGPARGVLRRSIGGRSQDGGGGGTHQAAVDRGRGDAGRRVLSGAGPDAWATACAAAPSRRLVRRPLERRAGSHRQARGRLAPGVRRSREYESRADVIRTAAARAHRVIDDEHYGALVPYVPLVPAVDPEPALSAIARRRPGVPPQDIVVPGREGALRDRLDEFIERGASKFVVVPVVPPANWPQEVTTLRESVAKPLE